MATKQTNSEVSLFEAVQQFCMDKGISKKDTVFNIIKESLITVYRKKSNIEPEQDPGITVEINDRNEVTIIVPKVVIESWDGEPLKIPLAEAQKIDQNAKVGDTLQCREKPVELSRIASNQVRQIVSQRLKDMEREMLYKEYKAKEGELTHGFFQRIRERNVMSIDLGKVEAIMPPREQNPNEKYKPGDRLKAIIAKVELRKDRFKEMGPVITLSRASADFVKKLFEMEIPEIYDGLIEIINIVRSPSQRTKLIVKATKADIDPIGACVGTKGVRIQSIIRELGKERIDLIPYSNDPIELITRSMAPSRVADVKIDYTKKSAVVVVPDEDFLKARGPRNVNVKLASRVTGYRIEVMNQSEYREQISMPGARERLDSLFKAPSATQEEEVITDESEEEWEGTPLSEIPGLSKRIIKLLAEGGIRDVESLFEMHPAELAKIHGIGSTTAEHILKLLAESVELVDEA